MKRILLLSVLSLAGIRQMNAQGTDKTYDGANVKAEGSTTFYQAADRPSITIARDGNSRIAQMMLDGESTPRLSTYLSGGRTMEIGFDTYTVHDATIKFYDGVKSGREMLRTSREEIDALHGEGYTIHYERDFTATDYEAIAVPFNIPAVKAMDAGMNIYRIRTAQNYYDSPSSDGFVDQGTEAVQFFIEQLKSTEVAKAGMPYLVKANAAGKVEFTLDDVTINLAESKTLHTNTTLVNYDFITSLSTIMAPDLSGRYVVRNGMLSYVISHPADLPEWRWYMEPSIIGDYIYYTDYRFVLAADEATEISKVEQASETPQAIYNLSGQRVTTPEKGNIYIINNKKVVY